MPLRETRRFKAKSKGMVVSFGDLMLPLVGLVAIVLLVVAGKIFFFSDFRNNVQPVPVTIAPPETPRTPSSASTPRADASEGVRPPVRPASQPPASRAASGGNLVLDLTNDKASQDKPGAVQVVKSNDPAPKIGPEAREEIVIKPEAPKPAAAASRPAAASSPKPQTRPSPRPAMKPAQPVQAKPQPARAVTHTSTWMVQVGAYSTKAAADAVVKSLAQAGYSASVTPSRTLNKVLVQAGQTRQDALKMAARLEQAGYPGAFVVLLHSS